MSFTNHYAALSLPTDVEILEIKQAHRKLVLEYHPDKVSDHKCVDSAVARFRQAHEAFEVLREPTLRTRYDRKYADELSSYMRTLGKTHGRRKAPLRKAKREGVRKSAKERTAEKKMQKKAAAARKNEKTGRENDDQDFTSEESGARSGNEHHYKEAEAVADQDRKEEAANRRAEAAVNQEKPRTTTADRTRSPHNTNSKGKSEANNQCSTDDANGPNTKSADAPRATKLKPGSAKWQAWYARDKTAAKASGKEAEKTATTAGVTPQFSAHRPAGCSVAVPGIPKVESVRMESYWGRTLGFWELWDDLGDRLEYDSREELGCGWEDFKGDEEEIGGERE
ncbi:hypothetical protein B0A49_10081 [Cryomyces minteri]|uniref:J domain-containing protein n=1 Tax=Cryomyces minteri TaxID=331657 RepID=A0A4U0WNS5_9PEZI|nr:hypothetical protein B0A49_10081 [Cryomyces minteri]